MLNRQLLRILVLAGLAIGLLACNPSFHQTGSPSPAPAGTAFPIPVSEADAPRVTVQEAKAAFDRGEAVIVDVRRTDFFVAKHIAGAVSITLDRIETNPAKVPLDKSKWIITYCT